MGNANSTSSFSSWGFRRARIGVRPTVMPVRSLSHVVHARLTLGPDSSTGGGFTGPAPQSARLQQVGGPELVVPASARRQPCRSSMAARATRTRVGRSRAGAAVRSLMFYVIQRDGSARHHRFARFEVQHRRALPLGVCRLVEDEIPAS